MAYRVYISTSSDAECLEYMAVVQRALFSINEVAISAMGDAALNMEQQHEMAKQLIMQADIFIGLYDSHYGDIKQGETASYLEAEYQHAAEANKPMLLFVHEEANQEADLRQKAFLEHIATNHVLTYFKDNDDLAAKVKLAIDRYRSIKEVSRKLAPSMSYLRDESKAAPPPPSPSPDSVSVPSASAPPKPIEAQSLPSDNLEAMAQRFLDVAGDDIEKIVRRALELHNAQMQVMTAKTIENMDGEIKVKPIWGEPLRRSQFLSDIFMIMPFREPYNSIYETVIRPLAAELNLTIKRGDDFTTTQGSIIQDVWAALNACRIVVAETTEVNANVYYELGIAHTLGKAALLLTQAQNIQDLPFDIRHLRFVTYENTLAGSAELKEKLRHSLIWLLNDLAEGGKGQASG